MDTRGLAELDDELLQEALLAAGTRFSELPKLALVCRRFRVLTSCGYFRKRLVRGEVLTLVHDQLREYPEKALGGMKVDQLALTSTNAVALLDDQRLVSVEEITVGTGAGAESRRSVVPVPLPTQTKVMMVKAGHHHVLLIDAQGQAFSWGAGQYGPLALSFADDVKYPKKIEALSGFIAIDCSASRHSFVVTLEGHLFAFGANAVGQLGDTSDEDHCCTPRKVNIDNVCAIKRAVAAYSHSIITTEGAVYTCGRNCDGRLGLGSELASADVTRPTIVSSLAGERVVDAAATVTSSLFLTDSGKVFACGSNHLGQLGLGTDDTSLHTPAQVMMDPSIRVVALSCGFTAAWLLTSEDQLFFFGSLNRDRTGWSSRTPIRIDSFGTLPIRHVASGFRRTSILL